MLSEWEGRMRRALSEPSSGSTTTVDLDFGAPNAHLAALLGDRLESWPARAGVRAPRRRCPRSGGRARGFDLRLRRPPRKRCAPRSPSARRTAPAGRPRSACRRRASRRRGVRRRTGTPSGSDERHRAHARGLGTLSACDDDRSSARGTRPPPLALGGGGRPGRSERRPRPRRRARRRADAGRRRSRVGENRGTGAPPGPPEPGTPPERSSS